MKFSPVNRYVLVDPIREESREETGVLLPQEYTVKNIHGACKILAVAPDCTREVRLGQIAIINNSMVEEVKLRGETFFLILENHVLGVIDE